MLFVSQAFISHFIQQERSPCHTFIALIELRGGILSYIWYYTTIYRLSRVFLCLNTFIVLTCFGETHILVTFCDTGCVNNSNVLHAFPETNIYPSLKCKAVDKDCICWVQIRFSSNFVKVQDHNVHASVGLIGLCTLQSSTTVTHRLKFFVVVLLSLAILFKSANLIIIKLLFLQYWYRFGRCVQNHM